MTEVKNIEKSESLEIKFSFDIGKTKKDIISFICGLDELYLKVILFLLCEDSTEDININYVSRSIYGNDTSIENPNGKILEILDFWQQKGILSCKPTEQENQIKNFYDSLSGDERIVNGASSNETNSNEADDSFCDNSTIIALSEALEQDSRFRQLIHEAQIIFQDIFKPFDLEIVYNLIYKHKIEPELIHKLAEVLASDNKKNIRYLEKVAIGLAQNGIRMMKDYESYYNDIQTVKNFEEKIKKMFAVEDYKFKTHEKPSIKKWVLEYKFGDDILIEGYNITKQNIQKFSVGYLHKIYTSWYEKGFKSLSDIKREFGKGEQFVEPSSKTSSFNINQFFEKAATISPNISNDGDFDVI